MVVKSIEISEKNVLPSKETLLKASEVIVQDKSGADHTFGSLYKDQKALIIFIRHFYCGACQDFLTELSAKIADNKIPIIIIGCGKYDRIEEYIGLTGCTFPIYANPDRKLYEIFGFMSGLGKPITKQPSYIGSVWKIVPRSIYQMAKVGNLKYGAGGDIHQMGGELLLGPGIEQCEWSNKMVDFVSHASIEEFAKYSQASVKA